LRFLAPTDMTSTFVSHYSTVMDLTDRQISRIDRVSYASDVARLVLTPLAAIVGGVAVFMLNKMATSFTDSAIWFRGASKSAMDDNINFGPDAKTLVDRTEASKKHLLEIRASLLGLADVKRPQVRAAIDRAIAATVDAYDALEGFKWAMYELEANHSPRIEGMTASTPEEFDILFKRLAQEA